MKVRSDWAIYAVAIFLSMVGHVALIDGLGNAARKAPPKKHRPIEVAVIKPPPPPPPEPEPPKVEPEKPKPKPVDLTEIKKPPPPEPVPSNTEVAEKPKEPPKPVFGVTMSSTVGPGSGSGFSVRVGNTLMKEQEEEFTKPEDVKNYAAPVKAHKVQKMPKRIGRCEGVYPDAARDLEIEGQVKLRVTVAEDGSVSDVQVVKGIGYGLDESAVKALKRCKFQPAMMGEKAVSTIISYTYTWILDDW